MVQTHWLDKASQNTHPNPKNASEKKITQQQQQQQQQQ